MTLTAPSAKARLTAHSTKVPLVTLSFWIIKILATTLGETGGDAVSMSLNLGYAVASLIFLAFFAVTLLFQLSAKHYHPVAYWSVVVATTTVGTTVSDFLDRTLGLGYMKSSALLLGLTLVSLIIWKVVTGKIEYQNIISKTDEFFYWLTILLANTLGTALGDFVADDTGLGFAGGAALFATLIALVAAGHRFIRQIPTAIWFWAAYVLTRPLGATVGDTLTKGAELGGMELGRITCSLIILGLMAVLIVISNRRHFFASPAQ